MPSWRLLLLITILVLLRNTCFPISGFPLVFWFGVHILTLFLSEIFCRLLSWLEKGGRAWRYFAFFLFFFPFLFSGDDMSLAPCRMLSLLFCFWLNLLGVGCSLLTSQSTLISIKHKLEWLVVVPTFDNVASVKLRLVLQLLIRDFSCVE